MRVSIILSILLLCFVTYTSANAKGAPVCEPTTQVMATAKAMGTEAKLGYTITPSSKNYTPGKAIQIKTVGTYKGLFITATDAKGNHVGKMTLLDGTRYVTGCKGDPNSVSTITHTAAVDKTALTATWTATDNVGDVTLKAIFVQGGGKGYQFVDPVTITATGGTPPNTTSSGGATGAPTTSSGGATGTGTGTTGTSPTDTTATTSSTPASSGMSISEYSSFSALVLANIAAVAILL